MSPSILSITSSIESSMKVSDSGSLAWHMAVTKTQRPRSEWHVGRHGRKAWLKDVAEWRGLGVAGKRGRKAWLKGVTSVGVLVEYGIVPILSQSFAVTQRPLFRKSPTNECSSARYRRAAEKERIAASLKIVVCVRQTACVLKYGCLQAAASHNKFCKLSLFRVRKLSVLSSEKNLAFDMERVTGKPKEDLAENSTASGDNHTRPKHQDHCNR